MRNAENGRFERIYKSPEELEADIERYLNYVETNTIDVSLGSGIVKKKKVPTVTGLAAFLGIDKATVIRYSKQSGYDSVYQRFLTVVEDALVQGALTGLYQPVVGIFLLKNNHGYKDQFDLNANTDAPTLPPPSMEDILARIPEEAITKYLDEGKK